MASPSLHGGMPPRHARVAFLDTLRGFTIASMVLFHAVYDLAYLHGVQLPWFTEGAVQDVWRASISWTFLFLAGWMTSFSRSNARRAALYAGAALLVTVSTAVASVDTAITFGILFCMASSTALFAALDAIAPHMPFRVPPALAALLCTAVFALSYGIYGQRVPIEGFAWLGFPSPRFHSGDYYPLIPFTFLYLAGAYAAKAHREKREGRYPAWMMKDWCPPLTWLGTKSLAVYLLHQPVLLGLLALFA